MADRVRQPLVMHLVGVDPPEGNGAYRRLHRVWKGLPKEVLERVLLWLPVADQVRLAAVCKAWRLLLCSRGFQEARTSLGLACRPQVSILDWHGGDDRTSSFHQVTVDLSFVTPSKYRAPGVWVKVRAVCGLLCMEAQKEWSRTREWQYSFCIVNVANKTWKELPPLGLTDLWQPFLSVKADDTSSGFQVFALFWGNGELCFALYSSTTGVWSAVTVVQGVVDHGLSVLASVFCVMVSFTCWRAGRRSRLWCSTQRMEPC